MEEHCASLRACPLTPAMICPTKSEFSSPTTSSCPSPMSKQRKTIPSNSVDIQMNAVNKPPTVTDYSDTNGDYNIFEPREKLSSMKTSLSGTTPLRVLTPLRLELMYETRTLYSVYINHLRPNEFSSKNKWIKLKECETKSMAV